MAVLNKSSATQSLLESVTNVDTEEDQTTAEWSWLLGHTDETLPFSSQNVENVEQTVIESLCRQTATVPFTNPCFGTAIKFHRASSLIIAVVGITLNLMTFLVLQKMKLNKESLFLMKMLSFYDSLYLFASMLMTGPLYISWVSGIGYIRYTSYQSVYHIAFCVYKISMSLAYWLVCLLTGQR